jgi:hypothetical protein
MRVATQLVLIAAGYGLAIACGVAAAIVHGLVEQSSGGMGAFGDMVLFVMIAGFLGLAPTWFLLRLLLAKAPRVLLAALLLLAAIGPLSWLALTGADNANLPHAPAGLRSAFTPFGAMLRIVAGPVLLVVEGVAFLLTQERLTRAILAAAMLMDLVPLGIFGLYFAGVTYR